MDAYVTFAGITVSYETSQYSVVEGEPVSVCAEIISGNSLIRFTLGLSVTTDAEGSGHKSYNFIILLQNKPP